MLIDKYLKEMNECVPEDMIEFKVLRRVVKDLKEVKPCDCLKKAIKRLEERSIEAKSPAVFQSILATIKELEKDMK